MYSGGPPATSYHHPSSGVVPTKGTYHLVFSRRDEGIIAQVRHLHPAIRSLFTCTVSPTEVPAEFVFWGRDDALHRATGREAEAAFRAVAQELNRGVLMAGGVPAGGARGGAGAASSGAPHPMMSSTDPGIGTGAMQVAGMGMPGGNRPIFAPPGSSLMDPSASLSYEASAMGGVPHDSPEFKRRQAEAYQGIDFGATRASPAYGHPGAAVAGAADATTPWKDEGSETPIDPRHLDQERKRRDEMLLARRGGRPPISPEDLKEPPQSISGVVGGPRPAPPPPAASYGGGPGGPSPYGGPGGPGPSSYVYPPGPHWTPRPITIDTQRPPMGGGFPPM